MATPVESKPTQEPIRMVLWLYTTVAKYPYPSYENPDSAAVLRYFTKHLDAKNYTVSLERDYDQVIVECDVGLIDNVAKLITAFNFKSWNHDSEYVLIGGTVGNPKNWV